MSHVLHYVYRLYRRLFPIFEAQEANFHFSFVSKTKKANCLEKCLMLLHREKPEGMLCLRRKGERKSLTVWHKHDLVPHAHFLCKFLGKFPNDREKLHEMLQKSQFLMFLDEKCSTFSFARHSRQENQSSVVH